MATTYATEVAGFGTTPNTKPDGGIHGGRLRRFRASFPLAAQASGDDIVLAKVPAGYRFAFGIINGSATFGASATATVKLPCDTATALIFTFPPMTTVPVRSFMTTLAVMSGLS